MSPFETQVAEALAATWDHALVRDCWRKGENYEAFGYLLACNIAPRVAAAIRAAYYEGHNQGRADADAEAHDDEAVGPDHDSTAALAALRGETP